MFCTLDWWMVIGFNRIQNYIQTRSMHGSETSLRRVVCRISLYNNNHLSDSEIVNIIIKPHSMARIENILQSLTIRRYKFGLKH